MINVKLNKYIKYPGNLALKQPPNVKVESLLSVTNIICGSGKLDHPVYIC